MAAKERFLNDKKYYIMHYFSRYVLYACISNTWVAFVIGERMTKLDIIKDIKWRIKDLRDTYEFWIKKINELPSHEIALEHQKELIKIANRKSVCVEHYTEALNYVKKCDEELDSANYNAFVALVRMDTLERLYETIKEDLQ